MIPDYEPEIQEVIQQNIRKTKQQEKKTFLSIGTHIGRYAIELTKVYGYESHCFEPSPETFKTLQINTLLSEVSDQMHLYNLCLGERDGETLFEYVADNDASSKMVDKTHTIVDAQKFITVPVRVYDHLHLDISPDLIIMDVE